MNKVVFSSWNLPPFLDMSLWTVGPICMLWAPITDIAHILPGLWKHSGWMFPWLQGGGVCVRKTRFLCLFFSLPMHICFLTSWVPRLPCGAESQALAASYFHLPPPLSFLFLTSIDLLLPLRWSLPHCAVTAATALASPCQFV